jgi:trk system potassium uptake protein TrkH
MRTGPDHHEGHFPPTTLRDVVAAELELSARAPVRPRGITHLQPVLYVIGILLLGEGGLMLVPAAIDLSVSHPDWQAFAASALATMFVGTTLALTNHETAFAFGAEQGFLLTTLAWVAMIVFGALPFLFAEKSLTLVDAIFESTSGFTTTGSTVIVGLDAYPPGLLLWRSLTQWVGGLGIVLVAIVILPFLRVGGMQLFRTESSDRSDKIFPSAAEVALWIIRVYAVLTVLCAAALEVAGMSWFDAVNHAMATLATGGFSTKDASIGFYQNPAIEWVEVVFMTSGALPMLFYARVVKEGRRGLWSDRQVRDFLAFLGAAIALMTLWVWLRVGAPPGDALRLAAFNVTSIVTDTGLVSTDFGQWGSFAVGAFFLLYFVGGCAGSTAGAVKIFRWQILFASVARQFRLMRRPHEVRLLYYNRQRLAEDLLASVANFFFLYVLTIAVLSLVMMLIGVDFLSSASGIAQAMANAGPGLGEIIGPAGNFAALPDSAKWTVSLAMLLGRLELFTVLVLFTPNFWRT